MKTPDFETTEIVNDKKEQQSCRDKTRIVIASGHPAVRQGLAQLISEQAKLGVCLEAENANQALDAIRKQEADLAIIDISLKDRNGIGLADKIKLQSTKLSVLILSMHDETLCVEYTSHDGARRNLVNEQAAKQIIKAIRFAESLLKSNICGFSILVKI